MLSRSTGILDGETFSNYIGRSKGTPSEDVYFLFWKIGTSNTAQAKLAEIPDAFVPAVSIGGRNVKADGYIFVMPPHTLPQLANQPPAKPVP